MKQSFTSGEAGRLCGLGLSTIKRWVRRDALKAHRTPGGDLRIFREDLLDFMRRFDIPMHRIEETRTCSIITVVDDEEMLQSIAQAASLWGEAVRLKPIKSDLDLGFALGREACAHIILAQEHRSEDQTRCDAIRRILAPARVRIGIIGMGLNTPQAVESDVAEVMVNQDADPDWARTLIQRLTGISIPSGKSSSRQAS